MTERWQPYWDWLRLVCPNDWIISFNYDLLVETLLKASTKPLGKARKKNFEQEPIVVLAPTDEAPSFPGRAKMLKLHGSVDWKRTSVGYVQTENGRFALTCADEEIGIASPGSNKLLESNDGLKPLWTLADAALRQCDAIVLLGYRFPPSDAHARRTIVSALAAHSDKKHHRNAHVVLMNNSPEAGRTAGILEYAMKRSGRGERSSGYAHGYQIFKQPLSVEDFLTVVERGQLFA